MGGSACRTADERTGRIEADSIPTALLGRVKGLVGRGQHAVRVGLGRFAGGDADADADVQKRPAGFNARRGNLAAQPLGGFEAGS